MSFSSTVVAVKALQESGEVGALHGRVAVEILIMQDLVAVMFLTASTGKLPSYKKQQRKSFTRGLKPM